MPTPSDFDAVRAKCLTQTDCGDISARAIAESESLFIHKPHGAWPQESAAWRRLADAAHVCEALLVRRSLSFTAGSPDDHPGPFNDGELGMGGA